jgi:excinuclease ABC subunit C
VEYHRKLRSKRIARSELDDIPGIGEKRKMLLLVEFGSLDRLRRASEAEIADVTVIGETIASEIFKHFHGR